MTLLYCKISKVSLGILKLLNSNPLKDIFASISKDLSYPVPVQNLKNLKYERFKDIIFFLFKNYAYIHSAFIINHFKNGYCNIAFTNHFENG